MLQPFARTMTRIRRESLDRDSGIDRMPWERWRIRHA